MLARIKSATLIGIEAFEVGVEVDAWNGIPKEIIVGLPDSVIKESRNRIKSAIKNTGFKYPNKVFTINLAPAEMQKEGSLLDVPIALGILQATRQINVDFDCLYIGELSLNGDVKPVRGIISICYMARQLGMPRVVVPFDNYDEASLIKGLEIIPFRKLRDIELINNGIYHLPNLLKLNEKSINSQYDFSQVKGQLAAKRALEIAAAGHHNILFVGPPGSGKTMLLKRLPTILPDLADDEMIEVQKIKSIAVKKNVLEGFSYIRPFRSPHHTISYAGMVGGGSNPLPGEISLAHCGVLFLDELPEFTRSVIEVLRQPIEDRKITISRANFSVEYPARFIFVASMNPCPCGYYSDESNKCSCQIMQVNKYWKKVSGPILDRFDLILVVPRLKRDDFFTKLSDSDNFFTSAKMKYRVIKSRMIQDKRLGANLTNGQMDVSSIEEHCFLNDEIKAILADCVDRGMLSGRSYHNVLKVARTIADLSNEEFIDVQHVCEALQFRRIPLIK